MTPIQCSGCGAPLALRLHQAPVACLACGRVVDLDLLQRFGVPVELLDWLRRWDREAARITGFGRNGDFGPDLNDEQYVASWLALRDDTAALLVELSRHLRIQSDLLSKVFESRSWNLWTSAEILVWRQAQLRFQLIDKYGEILGERFVDEGGSPPLKSDPLPIPIPTIFRSDEERSRFDLRFRLGAHAGEPPGLSIPRWSRELAEIERRLGLRS